MYLTDLTFIQDGNPNNLNSLINVWKMKLTWSVINEFVTYLKKRHNIEKVDVIYNYFVNVTSQFNENDMYHRSLEIEPRGKN